MAVLSGADAQKMEQEFVQDKKNVLAQRSAATNGLLKAAEDPFVIARNKNPYSTDLTSDELIQVTLPIKSSLVAAGCSPVSMFCVLPSPKS